MLSRRIIITVAILSAIAAAAWWLLLPASTPSSPNSNTQSTTTQPMTNLVTREPSSPDRRVYINQDWRFSFEYPVGWEVKESTFYSKASMFNASLWPVEEKANFPDPVLINITPKWWIDRLLPEINQQKNDPASIVIDGQTAIIGNFISHSVIESKQYFILLEDEYWIDISGKIKAGEVPGYANELQIVLDTFRFHNPPTLEEVGAEPYIPDYVKE